MGTSDLDRGLVGHLFNGYSMKHIKPELRAKVEKYLAEDQNAPAESARPVGQGA